MTNITADEFMKENEIEENKASEQNYLNNIDSYPYCLYCGEIFPNHYTSVCSGLNKKAL